MVLAAVVVLVLLAAAVTPADRGGAARPPGMSLLPLVALVVTSVAYLVVSELVTNINAIDSRLLSPVYATGVVLVAVALDQTSECWSLYQQSASITMNERACLRSHAITLIVPRSPVER